MRIWKFGYALSISAAVALIAGCGGTQLPTGPPQASADQKLMPNTSSGYTYNVLFSFGKYTKYYGYDPRGASPKAGLIDVKGTLYGTTLLGGTSSSGTVFSITPRGSQHVLYSFAGIPDGENPDGVLFYANGKLYGTTSGGGTQQGDGTVFAIDPSGQNFSVLHTFTGGSDGAQPMAGVIAVNGWLYGTTSAGGNGYSGSGTVFGIRLSDGKESVLHRFSGTPDGRFPSASLRYAHGTLYGTTQAGGKNNFGTVFSVRVADGKEKILHNFGGSDGASPEASLLLRSGTLYGTTTGGGANNDGTVFSVDIGSSVEKVLHNFNGSDGEAPQAALAPDAAGMLYGTTSEGGAAGYGTIFSIDQAGKETVLHNFREQYKPDGIFPEAPLLYLKRKLFGTTYAGGRHGHHCLQSQYCDYGTVFVLKL